MSDRYLTDLGFRKSWRSQSPRSNESGSKPNYVTAVDELTNWLELEGLPVRLVPPVSHVSRQPFLT